MLHRQLWRGFLRWKEAIMTSRQAEQAANMVIVVEEDDTGNEGKMTRSPNQRSPSHQQPTYAKVTITAAAAAPKLDQSNASSTGAHLVAAIVVHTWHAKLERAWRKWRVHSLVIEREEALKKNTINTLLRRCAEREAARAQGMATPMLRWRMFTLDASKMEVREELLKSVVGQSLLRRMSSITQRSWNVWRQVVQHGRMQKMQHEHAEYIRQRKEELEVEKKRTRDAYVSSKFRGVMQASLRYYFGRWTKRAIELKMDKRLQAHREDRSNSMFLAKMSSSLRSSLVEWKAFVYASKLVKLEDLNKETRVLDLLKHVLQTKLRSVVSRWHKYVRETVHLRQMQEAEEKALHEKREVHIKHKMRGLFLSSARYCLSKWAKYVHATKFQRQLSSHRSTHVESLFLSRLASIKRSCWIRWREAVHESQIQTLQFQAKETQVIQMIRNMLSTSTRKMIHRWHKYTLARKLERQHLKYQETYVATKLAAIMMSSLRYYMSRWHRHVSNLKLTRIEREAREHKATTILHRILSSTLRRCMTKWHRALFNSKLERQEVAGREARVLGMLTRLVSNGTRRVIVRWHNFVMEERYRREQASHVESRLGHGLRIIDAVISKFSRQALMLGWKSWTGMINVERKEEEHQDRLLNKVAVTIRKVAYRDVALAFHRMSRYAHQQQNHEQRVRSAKRRIIRELIANVNAKLLHALTTWRKAIHLRTVAEIERRHILDRQLLVEESEATVQKTRRQSLVAVEEANTKAMHQIAEAQNAHKEEQQRTKMIAAIKRLYDKGLEKMAMGMRKWKAVVVLKGHNAQGASAHEMRRREKMLSGLSMLSLYVKSKVYSAKMRRFHLWRSQSHRIGILQQQDAHRRQNMSLQKEAQDELRQNTVARLMQRTMMSDRALLTSIVRQWHMLAVHLAPLQRIYRRQSITHGGVRADGLLEKWNFRAVQRSFRIWSNALHDFHTKKDRKQRARTVTSRVLRRLVNRELAAAFHIWHRTRQLQTLHHHQSRAAEIQQILLQQRVGVTIASVLRRMQQLKLWRAMNKWCSTTLTKRITESFQKDQDKRTVVSRNKERMLYARLMLDPLLRWIQRSLSRAFSSWAFHTHIGVRIHIRSRKREGILRASMVLKHARLPGSRYGFLHRGWNTWVSVMMYERKQRSRKNLAIRLLKRMADSGGTKRIGRAFRKWVLVDFELRHQIERGSRTLALNIAQIVRACLRRAVSRSWRKWSQVVVRLKSSEFSLRLVVKSFEKNMQKNVVWAFHKWSSVEKAAKAMDDKKIHDVSDGFVRLHKTLFSSVPRRWLRSAFRKWTDVERNQRQQDRDTAAESEIRSRVLSSLVARQGAHRRHQLAAACWRWTVNTSSEQISKLTADLVRKRMHVTKLESKCTVYRNQQIRDAAISASFEKELNTMRRKMVGIKRNRREEKSEERALQRRNAVLHLSNMRLAQERSLSRQRIAGAWVRWREKVGTSRQADLADKLEESRVASRQAAGRISSLVERAQRERAQTVQLLQTMKQRTAAMEDHVVQHLVSSPGAPLTIVTPRSVVRTASAEKKRKKKKKKTPKAPTSPIGHTDPYNLIVEQMLRVVRSKRRTLYGNPIPDLLRLFQAIDLNCDGNISDAEFAEALQRLDIKITDKQMSHLLEEMRREDGRISFRGFVLSMKHHHNALHGLAEQFTPKLSSERRGTYYGLYKKT
jgi:hypothetical protein